MARSSARARNGSARLGAAREPQTSRAEPDFLARKNSRAEPSRLVQAREPARELDPIQFKNNFTMIDELILHH